MIIKNNLYTIINIFEDKILLLKNENNLYHFPMEYNVYNIKKNYNIEKKFYKTNKITMEKWFSHLDKIYILKLREITRRQDFIDSFIYIYDKKIDYPNGIYVDISTLLNYSFTIASYPYLIGILTNQLLLEDKYTKISKKLIPLEKNENKNYILWRTYMDNALDFNSYVAATKIFKIYNGQTIVLKDYTEILKKDIQFINKAQSVVDQTHEIIHTIFEHKENSKKKYIEQTITSDLCYFEDILNYASENEDHQLIISYFSRTKDSAMCAQYISYLIEQNDPIYEKEIEELFQLEILKNTITYDEIMTQIYHSGYLILNNKYQEALELLVDCYKADQRNKVLPRTKLILSPYRSIPNNYKFIILLLIKLLYELELAEFIDGEPYLEAIYNDYNDSLNDTSINKRVKDYYMNKVVSKFEGLRKVNIKTMNKKEKIILALKNMDDDTFNEMITLIRKLNKHYRNQIKDIIKENIKKLK